MKVNIKNGEINEYNSILNEVNDSYFGLKSSKTDLDFKKVLSKAILILEDKEVEYDTEEFCKYFAKYFDKYEINCDFDIESEKNIETIIGKYIIDRGSREGKGYQKIKSNLKRTNLANSRDFTNCYSGYEREILEKSGNKDKVSKILESSLENINTNISIDIVKEVDSLNFYIEGLRNFICMPLYSEFNDIFMEFVYNNKNKDSLKYNYDRDNEKELVKMYDSMYGNVKSKKFTEVMHNFMYYTSGYYRIFKDNANKTTDDITDYIVNRYSYKSIKKNGRILEKLDVLHGQLYKIFSNTAENIIKNYEGALNNETPVNKDYIKGNFDEKIKRVEEYYDKINKPNIKNIIINHKMFQFYTMYIEIIDNIYKKCKEKGIEKLPLNVRIFSYDKALEKDIIDFGSVVFSEINGIYYVGINSGNGYTISEVEYANDSGKIVDINELSIDFINSLLSGKLDIDLFRNIRPYCNLTETYLVNTHFGNKECNIYKKLIEDIVDSNEETNLDVQWLRDLLVANYKSSYYEGKLSQIENLSKKFNLFLYELRSSDQYKFLIDVDKTNNYIYDKQRLIENNRLSKGAEFYLGKMLVSPLNNYNRRTIMDNEPNQNKFLVIEGYNPGKRNTITMYLIVDSGILYKKFKNSSLIFKLTYKDNKTDRKIKELQEKSKKSDLELEKTYSGIRAKNSTYIEDIKEAEKDQNLCISAGMNYGIPYVPYKVLNGIEDDDTNGIYGMYELINSVEIMYNNYLYSCIQDICIYDKKYDLQLTTNNNALLINEVKNRKKSPIFKANMVKNDNSGLIDLNEDLEFVENMYNTELEWLESEILESNTKDLKLGTKDLSETRLLDLNWEK